MNAHAPSAGPRPRWWVLGATALAVVVVGGVAGGLIVDNARSTSSSALNACSATTVANKVLPTVVTISVHTSSGGGTGSGEVIRSNGYILTNNHVISAAANGGSISVLFSDGTTAPATLTGRDPQTDLAVIKVDKLDLPVIPLGSSSSVVVGEPVVALGAPLGLYSTVTSGIVSALDRTIEVPSDNGTTALLVSAIQTDAAINPGNSGGALTNCSGQLIGVPTAGASVPNENGQSSAGNVGLGFAIPVALAKTVSDEIISTGSASHAFLGIQVAQIPESAAQQAGTQQGLYVQAVVSGGPAAEAGLRAGDLITEIDGKAAIDPNQLAAVALSRRAGSKVPITYERNGRSTTTTITLGSRP